MDDEKRWTFSEMYQNLPKIEELETELDDVKDHIKSLEAQRKWECSQDDACAIYERGKASAVELSEEEWDSLTIEYYFFDVDPVVRKVIKQLLKNRKANDE